jgi:hypothetical protein
MNPSIPGRGTIVFFSAVSRQGLGPTQPPIKWVPRALSWAAKLPRREVGHLFLVPRSRMMELYLQSPVCLHCVMLNKLSTGTTLPLPMLYKTFQNIKSIWFNISRECKETDSRAIKMLTTWVREPMRIFEEAVGWMRPERVNKWTNFLTVSLILYRSCY